MRKRPHRDAEHIVGTTDDPATLTGGFVSLVSCPARAPSEIWLAVYDAFIRHPEHTGSRRNILRAEGFEERSSGLVQRDGLLLRRHVRRRLVPARPLDAAFDQHCSVYAGSAGSALLLAADVCDDCLANNEFPFYVPDVACIALRFVESEALPGEGQTYGDLRVEALPRPGRSREPPQPESRLFRTALTLLTAFRKRGEGSYLRRYRQRVLHDVLVAREDVQDCRLALRQKYAWAVDAWRESTDPTKHVFEDVCIAAYLISLFRNMEHPPQYFVDLGTGNGLLTFILTQEGFAGKGIDIRKRKSWALWRARSRDDRPTILVEQALDLPALCLEPDPAIIPEGCFLIGNHADEITPWVPLLATACRASGSLNIACCAHDLTDRFTAKTYVVPEQLWPDPAKIEAYESVTAERGGRYASFVDRVAELTLLSGWIPAREMLRSASSRNAAIVACGRFGDAEVALSRVRDLANAAQAKGFAPRTIAGQEH